MARNRFMIGLFALLVLVFSVPGCPQPRPRPDPVPDKVPAKQGDRSTEQEADLWLAVFRLADADHRPTAQKKLIAAGEAGYAVLVKAARVAGDTQALQVAAEARECGFFSLDETRGSLLETHGRSPGLQAAAVLVELLTGHGDLVRSALAAASPFERALALICAAKSVDGMLSALEELSQDRDPLVLEVAGQALTCAMQHDPKGFSKRAMDVMKATVALAKRNEGYGDRKSCEKPGEGPADLVDGIVAGRYVAGGTSASNGKVYIGLKGKDGLKVDLSAACALDLYEQAAAKGSYPHWLVGPVMNWGIPLPADRKRAAKLVMRDLDRFEQKERNKLLARAINAGFPSDRPVLLDPNDTFAKEDLLEAAGRQGGKRAKEAIERHVLCRGTFTRCQECGLLGFVDTPEAADLAYRIGTQCKDAAADSAVALIRMRHPKAVEVLGFALKEAFLRDSLFLALEENLTPDLAGFLRKAASKNNEHAKTLLAYLDAAGIEPLPAVN